MFFQRGTENAGRFRRNNAGRKWLIINYEIINLPLSVLSKINESYVHEHHYIKNINCMHAKVLSTAVSARKYCATSVSKLNKISSYINCKIGVQE